MCVRLPPVTKQFPQKYHCLSWTNVGTLFQKERKELLLFQVLLAKRENSGSRQSRETIFQTLIFVTLICKWNSGNKMPMQEGRYRINYVIDGDPWGDPTIALYGPEFSIVAKPHSPRGIYCLRILFSYLNTLKLLCSF